MTTKDRTPLGSQLAGLYNLAGVLGFTLFFTTHTLQRADPVTFSWLGLVSIMLWGLAYIAVARRYHQVRALVAVFAVEKAVYVAGWLHWLLMSRPVLKQVWADSPVHGAFLATYGLGDLAFGLFFGLVAIRRSGRISTGVGDVSTR